MQPFLLGLLLELEVLALEPLKVDAVPRNSAFIDREGEFLEFVRDPLEL